MDVLFASKLEKANVSNVCNVLPWPSEKAFRI